jgi:hypothetical protein
VTAVAARPSVHSDWPSLIRTRLDVAPPEATAPAP